jgi:hypothetical protein
MMLRHDMVAKVFLMVLYGLYVRLFLHVAMLFLNGETVYEDSVAYFYDNVVSCCDNEFYRHCLTLLMTSTIYYSILLYAPISFRSI